MILRETKSLTGAKKSFSPDRFFESPVNSSFADGSFAVPTLLRKAACPCGGGCPACRADSDEIIQTKLTVGEPNDEYEQEADRVADQVMRMPVSNSIEPVGDGPSLQLKPLPITAVRKQAKIQRQAAAPEPWKDDEEEAEEQIVQTKSFVSDAISPSRKNERRRGAPDQEPVIQRLSNENDDEEEEIAAGNEELAVAPKRKAGEGQTGETEHDPLSGIESSISARRGGEASLPGYTQEFMEDRFGVDFSGVRIHTDADSARLNRVLNSLAFTTSQDIYFSPGMYRPGTSQGDHLLAHELTHVVQQTGTSNLRRATPKSGPFIQRAGDETKAYTNDSVTLFGSVAHKKIEAILEAADSGLITEAPIPGGTSSTRDLNLVGFADLYKSTGSVVAGVRGKNKLPKDSASGIRELEFENMPTPATSKAVASAWKRLSSSGKISHGPRRGKKVKATGDVPWDVTPDFPKDFFVGDIKPLSMPSLKRGSFQVENYVKGFEEFVVEANKRSGGVTDTTGGMLDLTLPANIDYGQFLTESSKEPPAEHLIKKRGGTEKERIWIFKFPSMKGIYVYFSVPHPYTSSDYPAQIEQKITELTPVVEELSERHSKIAGKISTKRIDNKKTPLKTQTEKKKLSKKGDSNIVQLTPASDKEYWTKRRVAWEKKHKDWDKGTAGKTGAADFLKGAGKGPARRQEIDAKLNLPEGKGRAVKDEGIKIKKIKLWSGPSGVAIGKLRFYFGDLFDRLSRFFEKIKDKFEKWFKGADKLKPKGKLTRGWVGTATKVILEVGAILFKEVLQQGYSAFSACINGMFDKITERFKEDVNEKLEEEFKPVAEKVGQLNKTLREKFSEYEKPINLLIDNVDHIQQWTSILSGLETAIRTGVQVVSCGTPPGLGCLWGLVAQLAIGEALELLTDTNYFKDHIAKPTANKLMKEFVGNTFQNLVASSVETLGLQKYAEGVAECARVTDKDSARYGFYGDPGKFDPNAPDVVKARQGWEVKYHDKMMEDLLKAFAHTPEKGKKPKPVTQEDIEKLVEQLKKANLDPETLRALVKGAKKKGTKLVKFDDFLQQLEKAPTETTRTTVPDAPDAPTTGGDTPPTPPKVGTGKKDPAKPADATQGDKTQGGAKPADKPQEEGVPLFDANDLARLKDESGMVDNPNVIFNVGAKPDHEIGQIYEVMVHVFEFRWTSTITYDPSTDKTTESAPKLEPSHIYSISNVKAVVLDKKPGKKAGEFTITYKILENVVVQYRIVPDAEPEEHIIPKKNATAILKPAKK